MATLTNTPASMYAHCDDGRCPGHAQEPVPGILDTRVETYQDRDPSDHSATAVMPENTWEYYRFADPEQAPCPHCGTPRTITTQLRPKYEKLSGHDPSQLLKIKSGWVRDSLAPPTVFGAGLIAASAPDPTDDRLTKALNRIEALEAQLNASRSEPARDMERVEPHIYQRGETLTVKVKGAGQRGGIETVEQAREIREQLLAERDAS